MDMLEQLSNEIKREESSLWYNNGMGTEETKLIIKTITPSIKALIAGCPLTLIFGKKENYLCVGVRIRDISDGAIFISKVQYKSEEHNALICALKKGEFDISLINEMDILLAWSKVKISKEKALDILNWINDKSLYVGLYTKNVEYAHDCFCVSVESSYKYKYPNAHTIPFMEIETLVEEWNTISVCSYNNKGYYNFKISDKNEGDVFEKEIISSLISVFPSTLYKNPQVKIGNIIRELTDILAYYQYGCFLIEAKDVSVINAGFQSNKAKRILKVQKQVKKAIKQMTGAVKNFMEGYEIYTADKKKININRTQPLHCIILITEFIHEGDWSEIENLLFDAINKTGTFFNIMDFGEFIELLKASSGRPEIIDYNLMQRSKWSMENHTIHIKGV